MVSNINYWSKGAAAAPHDPESWEDDLVSSKQVHRILYSKKSHAKKINRFKSGRKKAPYDGQFHPGFDFDTLDEEDDLGYSPSSLSGWTIPERVPADVVVHIERLTALGVALRGQNSTSGVVATILLYAQTYWKGSCVVFVKEFLEDMFGMDHQSEDASWLDCLKGVHTNWKTIRESVSFKKVSAIISIVTALGLINQSGMSLSKEGLATTVKTMTPIHFGATDLIDAVLSTVTHFFEKGYLLFKTRDWRAIFADNREQLEFDDEFVAILKMKDYALTGSLETKFSITDDQYAERLNKLIDKAKLAHSLLPSGFEKKVYWERYNKLIQLSVDFETRRNHGGLRVSPLGICFYGNSSVGKSTAVTLVNAAIMNCFKLGTDKHVVTINEKDKYESNMRSNIVSVILDDVANSKPDKSDSNPAERIIRYVNNVISTAVMAEADMKGKVFIRNKLFFATTNLKDLGASFYSNEPVSVVRRMHLIITQVVRKEFALVIGGKTTTMLDSSKMPEGGLIADAWLFTVETAFGEDDTGKGARKPQTLRYAPYIFEGKKAEEIDIFTLIRLCCFHYKMHDIHQKKLVKQANDAFQSTTVCPICMNLTTCCTCACIYPEVNPNPPDPKAEGKTKFSFDPWVIKWKRVPVTPKDGEKSDLDKQAIFQDVPALLKRGIMMHELGIGRVHNCWIRSFKKFWKWFKLYKPHYPGFGHIKVPMYITGIVNVLALLASFTRYRYAFWILGLYTLLALYERCCSDFEAVLGRLALFPGLYRLMNRREHALKRKMFLGGALLGGIYSFCLILKQTRRYETQGNLAPTTEEEVAVRDAEESDWAKVHIEPIPAARESTTITEDQLVSLVSKNLTYIETKGGQTMNVLFVKSNLALIPAHILEDNTGKKIKDELIVKFVRYADTLTRGTWQARISKAYSYRVPDNDLRVVWIPNSPSFRDLTKYFTDDIVTRSLLCKFLRKQEDATMKISNVRCKLHREGYDYTLDYNTFFGLCGSVLVGAGKSNVILGIHTAGLTGIPEGRSSWVLKHYITDAEAHLAQIPGFCPAASEGTMETLVYEKQFFVSADTHPKSPTNFLDKGTTVQVYGQCIGRATAVSSVVPTVISDTVAEVTGNFRQHGPPKFKGPDGKSPWHPWRESLNKSGKTTIGVPGRALVRAVEDYQRPLIGLLHQQAWWRMEIMPLNRLQNVSGIDGKKFIKAMAPSTSVGFPLSGSKSTYMTDLDPEVFPSHSCPRAVDEMFWKEAQNMERKYLLGERAYPVFKGCLKDEPTKVAKDKVRVFQAAPLAFQLLIRKYYLPIARFMSCNPLVSECAVGINAVGPEWDQLTRHVKRFGSDNILAGDYSSYDLTMSPQLMFAAFSVMVKIAEEAGYQPVCLTVMKHLATDVCYPVVAYNGDLVELLGSNPSGQNLTVYINSIVNSLLFRAGYFTMCGLHAAPFRTRVSLITYGDDAKSSVHDDVRYNFDHIKFAKFLDGVGMKFTMPDKNSIATAFMTDEDADLLKRKNVYMPELGYYVGALDEESIFKSLHSTMQSKFLTPKEQAIQNIDTAISDWFYHGREVYEMRLRQMRQVAKICGIHLLCTNLDKSFDYWVVRWRNKYLREDTELPPPDQDWDEDIF